MSTSGQKDTIYIDIDDEITAIIDKLRGSPHKIVALVLPKRATVFQSLVNMKLLKRAAEQSKKNIVLITSEAALMPLAANVGVHVAKTLQSKPEIPDLTPVAAPAETSEDADLDKQAPVGALAGLPDDDEQIEVDNSEDASAGDSARSGKDGKSGKKGKAGKPKKDRKLKVPNFESFRKRLLLGGVVLVLLIVGWIMAFMVLPKATVTLTTDTSNLDTELVFTADPTAQALDETAKVLPATSKEFRKTDTEKTAATGQKDLGTKATGSVTLTIPCSSVSGSPPTIPAGTGVSTGNLLFVTTEAVSLTTPEFSSGCRFYGSTGVTAQNPGEQYNISADRIFAVSGYSAVSGSNAQAFTGGTSKMVKVISQQDIDNAKQKITDRAASEAPEELKKDLEEANHFALTDTLTVGNPTITSTPNVGAEASEVTVTSTTAFTMLGVKKDDIKKLVEEEAKQKIDTSKQAIRDNGLDRATIRATEKKPNGPVALSVKTIVIAGPQLDDNQIKQEIAGKKRGEAQDIVRKRPGIKDVEIQYSPFWVQSTPKKTNKITIVFKQNNSDADNKE